MPGYDSLCPMVQDYSVTNTQVPKHDDCDIMCLIVTEMTFATGFDAFYCDTADFVISWLSKLFLLSTDFILAKNGSCFIGIANLGNSQLLIIYNEIKRVIPTSQQHPEKCEGTMTVLNGPVCSGAEFPMNPTDVI
jgi:hypothetical protein